MLGLPQALRSHEESPETESGKFLRGMWTPESSPKGRRKTSTQDGNCPATLSGRGIGARHRHAPECQTGNRRRVAEEAAEALKGYRELMCSTAPLHRKAGILVREGQPETSDVPSRMRAVHHDENTFAQINVCTGRRMSEGRFGRTRLKPVLFACLARRSHCRLGLRAIGGVGPFFKGATKSAGS